VELDTPEVRAGDHVHVAGRRVAGHRDTSGEVVGGSPDEGVVEADHLLAVGSEERAERDPGLGALEDDVLVVQRDPEPVAEDLVAQADAQERLAGGEEPFGGGPERRDLGAPAVTRVPGSRTDDHQVVPVQRAVGVLVVLHHHRGHPEDGQDVPEHVDEVVLALQDRRGPPLELRGGWGAALVGEPELAEPLVP
jgi:hypothetical protein